MTIQLLKSCDAVVCVLSCQGLKIDPGYKTLHITAASHVIRNVAQNTRRCFKLSAFQKGLETRLAPEVWQLNTAILVLVFDTLQEFISFKHPHAQNPRLQVVNLTLRCLCTSVLS